MSVGLCVDQLGVDTKLCCRSVYAAFEYIAHVQLAPNLFSVDRLVSVGERGIARNHEHIREARQIGRHVVGDASAKYCCSVSLPKLAKGSTTIDKRGGPALPSQRWLTVGNVVAGWGKISRANSIRPLPAASEAYERTQMGPVATNAAP